LFIVNTQHNHRTKRAVMRSKNIHANRKHATSPRPALYRSGAAAAYLGISTTTLKRLEAEHAALCAGAGAAGMHRSWHRQQLDLMAAALMGLRDWDDAGEEWTCRRAILARPVSEAHA
jgi:hypothetical protein